MGAPSPPPPPDPAVQQKIAMEGSKEAAKVQGEYNLKALRQSQAASMIGQKTPVGSLSYTQTGVDKDGNPLYTMNAQLSPEQQELYERTVGTKGIAGAAGQNMLASSYPMYSDAGTMMSNLFTGADSLTAARVNRAIGFQKQFQDQDKANLDTQLRNQGITPDMKAYKTQMNRLEASQAGNNQNFIASVLPQSISEATSAYMMPLNTAGTLTGMGQADVINQMQTPQFTANPTNFMQAYGTSMGAQNANYQNQIAGYNAQLGAQSNMMSGLFGIGGGLLKAAPLFL